MSKVPQLVEALPLDRLHPHPDNPRLTLRRDTIEQIAAEIERDGFSVRHLRRLNTERPPSETADGRAA